MSERIYLTIETETGHKRIHVNESEDWKSFLIGRAAEADLFLNDPQISRRHCRIFERPRSVAIEDLGSRGGTFRNGERVTRPIGLVDGDAIRVGGISLRVAIETDEAEARAPAESEATIPPSAVPKPTDPPPAPLPGADHTVVAGPGAAIKTRHVDLVIPLRGRPRVVLGRAPECDQTLAHPTISRQHAEIVDQAGTFVVRDLGSSNGTFINGHPLTQPTALTPGTTLKIGPFHLTFDGAGLTSRRPEEGTRIEVRGIGKVVTHRETGKPLWLLKDISLTIQPKEFIGLLGSSGCGKSTFMDTVNGRRPATEGGVLYNGENLYNRFDSFKRGIGYVPQELIFHQTLPLADALRYASQLRLPDDVTDEEIEKNIDRVLEIVGLTEQRGTLIANLSGGQKKRVSIAMELLSRPTLLFLDEATSGLDLGTEAQMMKLFRELADGGVTTMCITHYVDSLEMCDMVAYFVKGRLAYYGPPGELKEYFGVSAIREVYVKEMEKTPEQWEADFRQTEAYRRYVVERAQPEEQFEATMIRPGQAMEAVRPTNLVKQFKVLTKRSVQVILGDRKNMLLALCLAPIVAILLSIVFTEPKSEAVGDLVGRQGKLIFVLTIVTVFLGIFGAIREIVKELAIYSHERFINLEIMPYLGSKILPLLVIGAIQVAELLIVVHLFTDIRGAAALQFFVLFFAISAAMLLGLAISAAVSTADKAILLMILAVIPQLLFANAIHPLGAGGKFIGRVFILGFWSHDAMRSLLPTNMDKLLANKFGETWGVAAVFLLILFAAAYAALLYFFMRKKDGPYGKPFHIPLVREGTWVEIKTRFGWLMKKLLEVSALGIKKLGDAFSKAGSGGGQAPPPPAPPSVAPPPPPPPGG